MAYDDLRSLLRALEREGDLKRIKAEVDPYLEVGEIVDRVQKAGGPALLFENVQGLRHAAGDERLRHRPATARRRSA